MHQQEISDRSGHGEGIPSIQSVQFHFLKWRRAFPDTQAILRIPVKERKKILKNLSPIVELAAEIEATIR